jgi:hypothetical protein
MKQRIHPGNIEVKWGLGWIPSLQRPIKLWHVVINGRTLASFVNNDDAWKWVDSRYEIIRHDKAR